MLIVNSEYTIVHVLVKLEYTIVHVLVKLEYNIVNHSDMLIVNRKLHVLVL